MNIEHNILLSTLMETSKILFLSLNCLVSIYQSAFAVHGFEIF